MEVQPINWRDILLFLATVAGVGLVLATLLGIWVFRSVRRINLPPNADFFEALRLTPISVVLLLDILDLSLDVLSAPVAWIILDQLGLKPLRGVSVVEAFIPGTQALPTMTIAWALARIFPNTPHLPTDWPELRG